MFRQSVQRKAGAQAWRVGLLLGIAALTGCAGPAPPFPNLPRLALATRFRTENLCNDGISPLIRLGAVPDGTAQYAVQITDINVLLQTPWREVIPLTSKTEIPEGAATTYRGPCLGDMTRFAPTTALGYQHRVEILAEDANGKPLAYGVTVVSVESAYITAKRERQRLQSGKPDADLIPTIQTTPQMPQSLAFPNPYTDPYFQTGPGYVNSGILQ